METINNMDPAIRKVVISLLLLAPILIKLGSIASTVATFLGFNGLTGLFISMGQFIAGLLPSLSTVIGAFSSLGSIASTVGSIIASSTAAVVAIGAALGLAGVKILDMLGVFGMIEDAAASLGQMLGRDLVDAIFVVLSVLTLGLFPLIASIGAAIVELVRGDISGAVDAFMQVWGIFGDAFSNIGNMVIQGLMNLGGWFVNVFSGIGQFVVNFLGDLADGFINFFLNTLPNLVLQGLVFLVSAVEVQLNTLFNLFASVFNGIISLISTAIDSAINGVIDIVNGFLEGIDAVADAVSDVIGRDIGDVETLDRVDTSQIAEDLQLQQRETGFSEVRSQNQQQVQGIRRQINNTEVNVDVGGDLQSDPYSFSRNVADQVTREQRQNNGT
jgi:hypothetical protein